MSLAAIIVIIFSLFGQSPTTFDLSADFSFGDNPNKVWQYGYSATNSLMPDQFRVDIQSDRVDMQCDSTSSISERLRNLSTVRSCSPFSTFARWP
jgi:hypothetical protein